MAASDAAPEQSSPREEETLAEWLKKDNFTLSMASSFFGFFAHAGALYALAEAGCHPAKVCGSSSGSIISALYAGGLDPLSTLPELILRIKRSDILTPFYQGEWGLGFFRINQGFLAANAPVKRLEESRCKVAISTYDLFARKVVTWSSGLTHEVVAASCAIPIIMQPIHLDGRIHVDGGVGDLLGLASCTPDERVLSIDLHTIGLTRGRRMHVAIFGESPGGPVLPNCTRLQLTQLPLVSPSTMDVSGKVAFAAGRAAMREALKTRGIWGGDRRVPVAVPESRRGQPVEPLVPDVRTRMNTPAVEGA